MVNILTRVRTAAAYEVLQRNPLLANGEPFYESDTGGYKVGDGVTRYDKLRYGGIVLRDEEEIDGGDP